MELVSLIDTAFSLASKNIFPWLPPVSLNTILCLIFVSHPSASSYHRFWSTPELNPWPFSLFTLYTPFEKALLFSWLHLPVIFVPITAAQIRPLLWVLIHIFQCFPSISLSKCFKSNLLKAKVIHFSFQSSPLLEPVLCMTSCLS